MELSVVVGNPKPQSRTLAVAEAVAHRVAGATGASVARTVDKSAEIHANLSAHLPGGGERATRARCFAAAERAAASAYRNHEVPPGDVRQAIRDSRPGAADQ